MYEFELVQLVAIAVLLALANYLTASTGVLVLCFGTIMSCGAIAAGLVMRSSQPSVVLALVLGGMAGGASGYIIGRILSRLRGLAFALATLAIAECTRIAVMNIDYLGGALGFRNENLAIGGYWAPVLTACVIALFAYFERSGFRHSLETIRQSEPLARSLGISPARHRTLTLALGGMLAGVAGVLYLNVVGILEPKNFGFESGLLIAAYGIIGGSRRYWGPGVAAVLLTLVPELLRFSSSERMLLYGASLTVVAIIWPDGFLSPGNFRPRVRPRKLQGATSVADST